MKPKKPIPMPIEFEDDDLRQLFDQLWEADAKSVELARKGEGYAPIVLAHGIARPDFLVDSLARTLNLSLYDLSLVSDRFHYFKGIASYLRERGFEVHHSSVSFAAGVTQRAKDLKVEIQRVLDKSGYNKVHIIAHSMGGLDARHMIVNEDMADKVISLTTIGTPHLGTSTSDRSVDLGFETVIKGFRMFINLEGFRDLTTRACREFNEHARNSEATNDVIYQTYASYQDRQQVFLPFHKSWDLINKVEGLSDGLVPFSSQKWTDQLVADNGVVKIIRQQIFPFRAGHLEQIGWWNLNKVLKSGWWNMGVLREKNTHEEQIKQVYLKIAKEITTGKFEDESAQEEVKFTNVQPWF